MYESQLVFYVAGPRFTLKSIHTDLASLPRSLRLSCSFSEHFVPTENGFDVQQGFRDSLLDADSFVHFEVTQPTVKITRKLYELELARRLEADCLPTAWGSASAVGLFVNGDRDLFLPKAEILKNSGRRLDAGLHITQVPFYLAFTPFRNLCSVLLDVKDGQQKLEDGQTRLLSQQADS